MTQFNEQFTEAVNELNRLSLQRDTDLLQKISDQEETIEYLESVVKDQATVIKELQEVK